MKAVELFAGAGGLGMGVSQAGFETSAVIERDKHCCETIRFNQAKGLSPVANWPILECDVRNLDFTEIDGPVDLLSGGPPCQPFSLGGSHRGYLDERDMFPEAIRAVRSLRPRAFLIENVRGLVRATFANYFEYICLQLAYPEVERKVAEKWHEHHARVQKHHTSGGEKGLRYQVVWRVLNAADYGIPQRRERVFLVGFRSDLGVEWSFPKPTHSREALIWSQWGSKGYWKRHQISEPEEPASVRLKSDISKLVAAPSSNPWRTVRDALSDLPDPEFQPRKASRFSCHVLQAGAKVYPGHTGSPFDEPAKTLKAGDHGVPGGENMLRRENGSVRYFSVRESARLQGFPDGFEFNGSWTESMRQLGNAVPVGLSTAVAVSIREQLENA